MKRAVFLVTQMLWLLPAFGGVPSFERYYVKTYPCRADNISPSDVQRCLEHTARGGLYLFNGIGIVRKGNRVCGIAGYYTYSKVDVTRFVGSISGNVATIKFSSSHNQEKIATGVIVLTAKTATWKPAVEGWEAGGGYHSHSITMARAKKPIQNDSEIAYAKQECKIFLESGRPFEQLGWDF